MKLYLYITLILSMLLSSVVIAQDFEGVATYKSQRKMEVGLDSTQINDEMRAQVMAMLKKQFEKEYTLEFNNHESIYKEVESLDSPNPQSGNMMFVVQSTGDSDLFYKNTKEQRFVSQTEIFSKQFLILDSLEIPKWEMQKDTKNIGEYTCFKASYKRTDTLNSSFRSTGNRNDTITRSQEIVEREIIAWYTPQIPVKNGPGRYGGLPGLILEASDGTETILCSKIVLNPKNGTDIKEPTKGKKVNQFEFDAIVDKKMKEQEERYQNSSRGDGNSFEIRIGG